MILDIPRGRVQHLPDALQVGFAIRGAGQSRRLSNCTYRESEDNCRCNRTRESPLHLTNLREKVRSGIVSERPFLAWFPSRLRGNEIVAIRHSDLRKALGIDDIGFLNDVVSIKHIGGRGIDLVYGERSRFRLRHGAVDEVPNRCGIRYKTKLDFHRLRVPERHNPASHTAAAAVRTMARCALLRKNDCALFGSSTSRRQFLSVRADSDISSLDLLFAWSAAQLVDAPLCRRPYTCSESDHCRENTRGTAHFEHSRRR